MCHVVLPSQTLAPSGFPVSRRHPIWQKRAGRPPNSLRTFFRTQAPRGVWKRAREITVVWAKWFYEGAKKCKSDSDLPSQVLYKRLWPRDRCNPNFHDLAHWYHSAMAFIPRSFTFGILWWGWNESARPMESITRSVAKKFPFLRVAVPIARLTRE